ncbi:MAG: amidohydrolase family protein, partial [Spirochaetes bacterium]|nr:amidohydrolase family protein [Spirochaetota bacterium]
RTMYGEDLDAKTIFNMVTSNPAKAFRMHDRIGSLEAGKQADILVLKARHSDPYENLAQATMEDIEFLSVAGQPVYADDRFSAIMPDSGYESIKVAGRTMQVRGEPDTLYKSVRMAVGFNKKLAYMPFEC